MTPAGSMTSQVALFANCDAHTRLEIFDGLRRSGLHVLEPANEPGGAFCEPWATCPCKVAVVVAQRDRHAAITIASELGRAAAARSVVLIADEVTAGEYDQLVNWGPVRYIYSLSEPVGRIAQGVVAAVVRAA